MFKEIIDKILEKNPRILVIGDLMLDRFIFGNVERISPEAPVPIVKCLNEKNMLGGCGNVIRNLDNIGVQTSIISAIGKDITGELIIDQLNEKNIPISGILIDKNIWTTEKMRILADAQQVVRVDWDAKEFNKGSYDKILGSLPNQIKNVDGIIVSDYNKGVCSQIVLKEAMAIAKANNIPVFVDPKGKDWSKYHNAHLITPNKKEAELVIGKKLHSDKDFESAGKKICRTFDIYSCLITRGSTGMSYISSSNTFHLKSKAKEIFDVSGAGDTVISMIAASLVSNVEIEKASKFANKAAGIVVGHIGTTAITVEELLEGN